MKRSILVIGVTGVGKSTLTKLLQELGHEAYSIEDIEGMFEVYRKRTREVFRNYDITNPEHIDNSDWICHVDMLKELLANQKEEVAFYCGVASNIDEIIPLFDNIILLKISNEKLYQRLLNRKGKEEEMGSTEKTRQRIFGWKDWWENEMEKRGALVVNADGNIEDIANEIIDLAKLEN